MWVTKQLMGPIDIYILQTTFFSAKDRN